MKLKQNGKVVKCDQKVDITATFGSDLVLEGSTAIPNILLKIYSKIGITDMQMMLLIQMIRLNSEGRVHSPTPEMLAEYMESDPARIKKELAELLDKEIITTSQYYDYGQDIIFEGYDFESLFLKISDIWSGIRAREIEETEKILRMATDNSSYHQFNIKTTELISIFEKEFGRPLSPIEVEQIEQWSQDMEAILVYEALKRAVLRGKHNFKYINSILLEWKKNNLRTLEAIEIYDREYKQRRLNSKHNARTAESQKGSSVLPTDSKINSKKKAFIRSLYI
jgi:DNA replication protein